MMIEKARQTKQNEHILRANFSGPPPGCVGVRPGSTIMFWGGNFSATPFALNNPRHRSKDNRRKIAAPLFPVALFPCFQAGINGRRSFV